MMPRRAALAAALLFAGARAAEPCDGDAETCTVHLEGDDAALSLRQLRAVGRHEAQAASGEDADFDPGLPGGWGEADKFAAKVLKDEQDAYGAADAAADAHADGDNMHAAAASGRWGSCAHYRCVSYYVRHHGCQCNAQCQSHRSCCWDYYARCARPPAPAPPPLPPPVSHVKIMTLYHMTGLEAGPMILANGFRPGFEGWCGGGIYFATTPQQTRTKAIGPESHQGFLIEATVNVGLVKYMPATCDRSLTGQRVASEGYDSVSFNPGDGQEYIVYSASRVISSRRIAAEIAWQR